MPNETWPLRPFDPACADRVPADAATIAAVRRVVADWDGENWAAVEPVLQRAGLLRPLAELTVFDVRMQFAVGQRDLVIALGGRPETATGTVHVIPAPPAPTGPPPRRAKPSECRALAQYEHACERAGRHLSDADAYKLARHLADGDRLPAFDTWARQVRGARKAAELAGE